MADLNEEKELLLCRLRSEMAAALVNDPHVRLCIENIDFMNLAHLITDKDLVIDLKSLVNAVLNKEINDNMHVKVPIAQLKTNVPKCKTINP